MDGCPVAALSIITNVAKLSLAGKDIAADTRWELSVPGECTNWITGGRRRGDTSGFIVSLDSFNCLNVPRSWSLGDEPFAGIVGVKGSVI